MKGRKKGGKYETQLLVEGRKNGSKKKGRVQEKKNHRQLEHYPDLGGQKSSEDADVGTLERTKKKSRSKRLWWA